MSLTSAQLNSEITTDPVALGYAGKTDAQIAGLLNSLTGPGAATVSIPSLTGDQFRTGILPAAIALPSASAAIQAKYQPLLAIANSANAVDMTNAYVLGALASLVSDGLLTQAQADAIHKRIGSRAEVLGGVYTVVQTSDVTVARMTTTNAWKATVVSVVATPGTRMVTVTANFVAAANGEVVTQSTFGDNLQQTDIQNWISATINSLQNRDASNAALQSLVGTTY